MNIMPAPIQNPGESKIDGDFSVQKSIVICDSNPILSWMLRQLFLSDAHLSGYYIECASELNFETLAAMAPTVLIVDPFQSDTCPENVASHFAALSVATALVGYCTAVSRVQVLHLNSVGFRGVAPKAIDSGELVRMVCAVAFGGTYLHASLRDDSVVKGHGNSQNGRLHSSLTERENDVLRGIALGSSIKEIASILNISTKTVDTYKTRANQKLNLHSRSDIVEYAIKSGWML